MKNMENMDYLSEGNVVKVDIREIVNLPEWQELRGSLVGCWKKDPEGSLLKLKKFGGNLLELSNRRLRILQNYVTGSGFRIGIISSPSIIEYTNLVKEEVARRKDLGLWL